LQHILDPKKTQILDPKESKSLPNYPNSPSQWNPNPCNKSFTKEKSLQILCRFVANSLQMLLAFELQKFLDSLCVCVCVFMAISVFSRLLRRRSSELWRIEEFWSEV
jgi:hypothetical protein